MKRLLIGYITKDLGSGINQYILNFVNHIDEDVEIDFITREDSKYIQQIKENILKEVNYNNIYTIPNNKKPISSLKALNKIMKDKKYDIAYFNVSSAHDNLGLLAAKHFGIEQRIIHSHNSAPSGKTFVHRFIRRVLNMFGKNILSKTANVYLSCSDKAAKWLFPSYIYNSNSYTTIYNSIECSKYMYNEKKRNEIRKDLNIGKSLLIGNVARFNISQKNNLFLIDILKELIKRGVDTKLICIGDGPDLDTFKEYAQKNEVLDKIILTGRVSNVEDYIQAMDVFLLPSKFEGLPITGVEAQFSNIPCLFSNTITKDVIIGKNSKLLSIKSASLWVDEIIKAKDVRENDLLSSSKNFDSINNNQTSKIINNKSRKNIEELSNSRGLNFELLFAFLFMVEGFFQACNITVGHKIISFVLWPMTFLGFLILLNRLIRIKKYKINIRSILLVLFDLTLLIPAFVFKKYRLYLNIKFFILMMFQFCILYLYSNKPCEKKKYILTKLLNIFVILSVFIVLGSFYTLAINYNHVINTVGDPIVFGISAGRLFGIFWDPNIGALISTISFVITLHKFALSKSKFLKIVNVIFAFIFALYVSFSASRMGIICLIFRP